MSGPDGNQSGDFRQRLDANLRQRNPSALRAFLIAEGQWQPEARTDEEAAMWMMIAASPVLADLHAEAERWLMAHGHEHEAQAILGRRRGPLAARSAGAAGQRAGQRGSAGGAGSRRRAGDAPKRAQKGRPQRGGHGGSRRDERRGQGRHDARGGADAATTPRG